MEQLGHSLAWSALRQLHPMLHQITLLQQAALTGSDVSQKVNALNLHGKSRHGMCGIKVVGH